MEFTATSDYKSNKPVAIRVRPLPAGSVEIDTLCDKPVTGTVESEAHPSSSGLPSDQGLGTVSYDRNGVCLLANILCYMLFKYTNLLFSQFLVNSFFVDNT